MTHRWSPQRAAVRQVAPFGGAGVLGFIAVLIPPVMSGRVLLAAGIVIVACCVTAISFAWARPPHPASVALPLAYLVALSIMMHAAGGPGSALSPLIVVPVFWVAMYGTRPQLTWMVVTAGAMNVGLAIAAPSVGEAEWRRAVLWVAVTALVGFSSQSLVHRVSRESKRRAEEQAFADAVLGQAGALVVLLDRNATILWFNAAVERASGIPLADATGKTLWDLQLLPDDEIDGAHGAFDRLVGKDFPFDYEAPWIGRDGVVRRHMWSNTAMLGPDGEVEYVVGVGLDVTAQRETEAALRESQMRAAAVARASEARFVDAFHSAPVGMALVGLDGHFLGVNHALCEITGYAREQLEGTTPEALCHPDDFDRAKVLRTALVAGEIDHYDIELRYIHLAGHARDVAKHVTLVRDVDGNPANFVMQFMDITERKQFQDQLQHMADHDSLTGLLNRRRFNQELERHVAHVQRYGAAGAVLMLDIDHFKQINDTLGHQAGDQLIIAVADVISANLRASDVVARLGGDEFAILLPKADLAEARIVADKLVGAVRGASAVLHGDQARSVTISLGATMLDQRPGLNCDDIVVDADLAMYDAKDAGRDRAFFAMSDERAETRTRVRMSWLERIEQAIEDEDLVLEAQPIVELATNRTVQHELLVRMFDGSGDRLPPASFLSVADRHGLIGRIDAWVVREAIDLLAQAAARGMTRRYEVNIAGRSMADPKLLERVSTELARTGVDPGALVLQLSEATVAHDPQGARRFAHAVRDLGCRFALDDFGANAGSFASLKYIPFDYVKIDGEFVRRCVYNRTDQLVISSLVGVTKGLGKETVAEFVPDAATFALLARLGVDLGQGVHIGMPRPLETFDCAPHSRALGLAGSRRRLVSGHRSRTSDGGHG